jgi:hypothetical protein
MPIPTRNQGEPDDTFISRCIEEISGEYDVDQAAAICYAQLDLSQMNSKEYRRNLVKGYTVKR